MRLGALSGRECRMCCAWPAGRELGTMVVSHSPTRAHVLASAVSAPPTAMSAAGLASSRVRSVAVCGRPCCRGRPATGAPPRTYPGVPRPSLARLAEAVRGRMMGTRALAAALTRALAESGRACRNGFIAVSAAAPHSSMPSRLSAATSGSKFSMVAASSIRRSRSSISSRGAGASGAGRPSRARAAGNAGAGASSGRAGRAVIDQLPKPSSAAAAARTAGSTRG